MKFRIDRVCPTRDELVISADEARALLEVMAIALGADRRVDDDERACFVAAAVHIDALVGEVVGPEVGPYRTAAAVESEPRGAMSEGAAHALLDALLPVPGEDAIGARGDRLLAQLRREATRELAFRLAVAASIADLSIEPAEDDLIAELRALLAIERGRATDLMAATYAALGSRR